MFKYILTTLKPKFVPKEPSDIAIGHCETKSRFSKNNNGYTLVEILLVVLLIVISTGFSVVNFSKSFRLFELKNEAKTLAYSMRYAQYLAISKQIQTRLVFDLGIKSYWIEQQDKTFSQIYGTIFKKLSSKKGREHKISQKLKLQSNVVNVNFYPDGTIDKQTIDLCDKNFCVTVSTQTARSRVEIFKKIINEKH